MQGFVEVEIGVAQDQTQFLANNAQSKRKKYGMKNYVIITTHTSM